MGLIFMDTSCKLSPNFLTSLSSIKVDEALETIRYKTGVTVEKGQEFVSVLGDWESVKNAHSILEEFNQKTRSLSFLNRKCSDDSRQHENTNTASAEIFQRYNKDTSSRALADSECKEISNSYELKKIKHSSRCKNAKHADIFEYNLKEKNSDSNENFLYNSERYNKVEKGQDENEDLMDDDTDVDEKFFKDTDKKNNLSTIDSVPDIKQDALADQTATASNEYTESKIKYCNEAHENSSSDLNGKELNCFSIKKEISSEKDSKFGMQASLFVEEIPKGTTKGLQRNQFTCKLCSKTFKRSKSLRRHIQFVHTGQGYSCKVCNKKYKQSCLRSYKNHIKKCKEIDESNIGKCGEFKCGKCSYTGKSKIQFTKHILRMHQNKLTCGVCFKQFGSHEVLQRHYHRVHSGHCYRCNICEKVYSLNSRKSYKKHLLSHDENHAIFSDLSHGIIQENENSSSKAKLKTVKINEVLSSPDDLVDFNMVKKQIQKLEDSSYMDEDTDVNEDYLGNIDEKCDDDKSDVKPDLNIPNQEVAKSHVISKKSAFYCLFCDKSYKSSREYRKHMSSHGEDYIELQFKCETCHRSFSTETVLKAHIEFEHNSIQPKDKLFICPVCNKEFDKKYKYRLHMEIHQGIKRYVCDVCGKAFRDPKSFRCHKYLHEEVKQFSCHICAKTFRQKSGLDVHLKVHSESRDYICHTCGKGFTQRSALNRHERVHTGEKPFKCAVCFRTFNDYSIIRRHMIMLHKRDKDPSTWQADVIRSLKSSINIKS